MPAALKLVHGLNPKHLVHEFNETCHFRYILFHEKKTPNDAVTQRHSQFTPKMKANAEWRLLSSLV